MLGTGEFASSANESTSPSWTSSSWRSGTYCRQIGSPGDLIRSTMAGEIRNSKFRAASRSRSRSGKCSGPNLATSASSVATLCLRSSSCQDAMRQVLDVHDQVVVGRVIARDSRGRGVAAPFVVPPGGRVSGAGRRLDDDQAAALGNELLLDGPQQQGPDSLALPRRVHHDPVEVVGPFRPRRGTPARVPDQPVTRVCAQEAVIVIPGQTPIQQLQGGRDLFPPEEARRRRQPLKPCAL